MNRRSFTKTALTGGAIALVAPAVLAPSCNGPKLDAEIAIADVAINALNVIVPNVAPLTAKILKLLKDIDADAKAGKFDSAQAAFDSLSTFIQQLQDDAGIALNDRAKLILVTILSAIRAIGLIVKNSIPASAKASLHANVVKALDTMTSPSAVNELLNAAKMKF